MKEQSFLIKKKLSVKLYTVLISYILAGFAAVMLFQMIFLESSVPVIEWLYWRLDVIYFFYLCIGAICIFHHYWQKPWNYLDEVINATQTVYEQSSQTISLSEPLREVERHINQIKMSVLLGKQALKEAEERKKELVMYLAHDIRTPLTAVIGYLSLLDEAPDMPAEQKAKYVRIALDKAERLEMLLNELFEITRYNMETVRLQKTSVDLYALLAQVADEFYPVLSERGNKVCISAENNLLITGDGEKLARVFNNLLKNAVSYSYPDTEIDIAARRKGEEIEVVFENRGEAIPEEELAGIFEKFHRLDEARASNTGGAGLGLSIAKEIVALHGGEIRAESSGERVAFVVTLPVSGE